MQPKHRVLLAFCLHQIKLTAYYLLILTPFRYIMIYKFRIEALNIPASFLMMLTMSDKLGDLYRFASGEVIETIMALTLFQNRHLMKDYTSNAFKDVLRSLLSMSAFVVITAYIISSSIVIAIMLMMKTYTIGAYLLALFSVKNLIVFNAVIRGVNDSIYEIPIKNVMVSILQMTSPVLVYLYICTPTSIVVVCTLSGVVGLGTVMLNYALLAHKVKDCIGLVPINLKTTTQTTMYVFPAAIINNLFKFLAVEVITVSSNVCGKIFRVAAMHSSADDILDASLNYSIYRNILGTYDIPITMADKIAANKAKDSAMIFNATFITSIFFTVLIYSVIFYGIKYNLLGKIFFLRTTICANESKLFLYGIPLYIAIKPIEIITIVNKRLKFQNIIYITMIGVCIISFITMKCSGLSTNIAMAYTNIIKSAVFFILSGAGGYFLDTEGVITVKGVTARVSIILGVYFGLMWLFGI